MIKTVFRSYDIRGLYPEEIDEGFAEKVGKAFGTLFPGKIAVGMDARISGPALKKALVEGLLSTGAQVIDIGLVPTPLLYFAVASNNLDGGIMVSASHNPKDYNGFKFCKKGAVCFSYEEGINRIESLMDSGSFKRGEGVLEKRDVLQDYIEFVKSKVSIRPAKVVIDAGNGGAGPAAVAVFESLGCKVTPLYCKPDGRFPNHEPDPTKKGVLKDLQEKVLETGSELGIALDGDGDRACFVDEKGNIVEGNKVFALLVEETLKRFPGAKILYEVVVSRVVEDSIRRLGGIPVISRVGHTHIQTKLLNEGCQMAGEASGHYFFRENFGYDDGIFAALKLMELLRGRKLSELAAGVPEYITSEVYRLPCPDERKFKVVEGLKKRFSKKYPVIDIDGVRVNFPKGWFIIRASNTAPQLVVRWEASDRERFNQIGRIVRDSLSSAGIETRSIDL